MNNFPPIPRPSKKELAPPPIPRRGERPQLDNTERTAETFKIMEESRKLGFGAIERTVALDGGSSSELSAESIPTVNIEREEARIQELLQRKFELISQKRKVEYAAGATHNSDKIERDRERNFDLGEQIKRFDREITSIRQSIKLAGQTA